MAKPTYPTDEFDAPREQGAPVGVHRSIPRAWTRLLALLLTVGLAAGAAYGGVQVLYNADKIPIIRDILGAEPAPSHSAFVTLTPTFTPSPTPTASPSASPSPSETVVLNYGTSVRIFNDAGISGLAGKVRDFIAAEGFTNISVADWNGASAPGNVIRYSNIDDTATAEYIARQLGIGNVSLGPTNGVAIEIVLIEDPLPEPSPSASPSANAG